VRRETRRPEDRRPLPRQQRVPIWKRVATALRRRSWPPVAASIRGTGIPHRSDYGATVNGSETSPDRLLTIRFGLLATSIAGRPLAVAGSTQPCWTDGRTIYLDIGNELQRQVIVQAALLRAGSLEPSITRDLVGRPGLARRYLSVEGRRALALLADVFSVHSVAAIGNMVAPLSVSAVGSLGVARSRKRISPPPSWFGVIKPWRTRAQPSDAQLQSAIEAAKFQAASLENEQDTDGQRDTAIGAIFKLNRFTRALRNSLALHGAPADSPGRAAMGSATLTVQGVRSRGAFQVDVDLDHKGVEIPAPRVNCYPEWDARRQSYRSNWCSVEEFPPRSDELSPLERSGRHDTLRRTLAPLGLGLRRQRRQPNGYDLDLDAAIETRVQVQMGVPPSQAVYLDNLRRRRELAVLVLLDASGSSNEINSKGSALYHRQRDAAAALIDTLAILGDRVAGYAFRSQGRAVGFVRIKGFDEPFAELAMARLGSINPGGYTRLGAAVRHATYLLLNDRSVLNRLIVVISDGYPYDMGYDGVYAESDARRAVDEARGAGVACICLNFESATDSSILDRVFGVDSNATSRDMDTLAPTMLSLIVKSLDTARRA
jgi:nitric oxide reductase NorD protein